MKDNVDEHFDNVGQDIFKDVSGALAGFGEVVSGGKDVEVFCLEQMKPGISGDLKNIGLKLLNMQKWALSSLASCAWFFDDIGRIEPLNSMTFALRALELGVATGMKDIEKEYRDILAKAVSNDPELGTGRDLWFSRVKPRQEFPQTVINQALVRMKANESFPAPGEKNDTAWPGVEVNVERSPASTAENIFGKAKLCWEHEAICEVYDWKWEDGNQINPFAGCVTSQSNDKRLPEFCLSCSDMPWEKRQALSMEYIESKEHKAWEIITADLVETSYLFMPFQEGQSTQNAGWQWSAFWKALAWTWFFQEDFTEKQNVDLKRFIIDSGENHPEQDLLVRRFNARLAEMMEESSPDWGYLARIIGRIKDIGLGYDLWYAQNVFWKQWFFADHTGDVKQLLGF